jgi:hypothetical protein
MRQQVIVQSDCRAETRKVFRESNNNDLTVIRKIVIIIILIFDKLADRTRDMVCRSQ